MPVLLIGSDKQQEGYEVSVRRRTRGGHKKREGIALDGLKNRLLSRSQTRC
ncbi:hypothetical protein [Deinococcus sp. JMULE3]|uniref:hypothetical protein n=1 Tax=Deinococcus sp. JMULE3 TaxID=2518341 RepID=UPI001575D546|nr:hypothetical protein [Deinococcus sp. JMULE3]